MPAPQISPDFLDEILVLPSWKAIQLIKSFPYEEITHILKTSEAAPCFLWFFFLLMCVKDLSFHKELSFRSSLLLRLLFSLYWLHIQSKIFVSYQETKLSTFCILTLIRNAFAIIFSSYKKIKQPHIQEIFKCVLF